MVDCLVVSEEDAGSNPVSSVCISSSTGRASRCQREGCGIVAHLMLKIAARFYGEAEEGMSPHR